MLDVNSIIPLQANNIPVGEGGQDYTSLIFKSELSRLINPAVVAELEKPFQYRAVVYLRVSTKVQAEKDKVSLSEQKQRCIDMVKREGWEYLKTYHDDGFSGTKIEGRDEFQLMLDDARQGLFDIIVCWDLDRFSRDHVDLINLQKELKQKHKVQITSVNCPLEIEDPRLMTVKGQNMGKDIISAIMGILAESENKKRVQRMNLGKYGKAKKGMIPCKAPYGYRIRAEYENGNRNKRKEWVEVEPNEAKVVKEIFDLYDYQSWGIRKIVNQLNDQHIKPPRADNWCYTSVRYILQNITYAKWVRYGWRLSESKKSVERLKGGHQGIIENGKHPSIIERDQFLRVRNKLRVRAKLGGRAIVSKGLLTGIIKCGRCGGGGFLTSWPNWWAYKHAKEEREHFKRTGAYLCSNYTHKGKSGCTQRYLISAGKIEKIVLERIKLLASNENAQKEFITQMRKNRSAEVSQQIKRVKQGLEKLAKKRERIKTIYIEGNIDPSEFSENLKKIDLETQVANQQLEKLNHDLANQEKIESQTKEAILALYNFDSIWDKADYDKKKELLSTILEKVVVDGESIEIFFAHNDL
ncbi:MAG: recombinase family protein [Patescibacteria group bacterium]|jgi:site-specific DNA recombinase